MASSLDISGINKRFGKGDKSVEVLHKIDIHVAPGEFLILVGPSGCGKSTLLNIIAGLDEPTEGEIRIAGNNVVGMPPRDRDIAMVFQSYALYPTLSVADNIGFALEMRKIPKAERKVRIDEVAAMLQITHLLDRRPSQLSGGQRQRVAMGRALARQPQLFLFDEPLSNLDAALRGQTRVEIANLHRALGATTIYVTHDQVEAMTLADRVVVLRDGQIEQVGTPLELYDRPANQFVAQFIGTPRMNVLAFKDIEPLLGALNLPSNEAGFIGLRPESVTVVQAGTGQLQAKIEIIESLGAETLIYVRTPSGVQLVARQTARTQLRVGDAAGVQIDMAQVHVFSDTGRVQRSPSLTVSKG